VHIPDHNMAAYTALMSYQGCVAPGAEVAR
jgi:hypothetical protein